MKRLRLLQCLLAASLLAGVCGSAEAQALFLARRAIGRIEQMSQTAPTTGAAYDVATVIVEVSPDKVFDTIKRLLGRSTEVRVTRIDDVRRSIEFTDGVQIGGIQVSTLGDDLSQLIVSTAHPGVTTSTTSTLVTRILGVCRELNVVCQRADS